MGDGIARHTPQLTGATQCRVVQCDSALFPHIGDVITTLADSWRWLEVGDSVDDTVTAVWSAIESFYGQTMIGKIDVFLKALPTGWLSLDGATYSKDDYPLLYEAIDASFKNETAETFTLPDFDGRFVLDAGSTYNLGDTGGEASHVLTVDEMPEHTHTYLRPDPAVDIGSVGTPIPGITTATPNFPTGSAGNGSAHENRPPYIAVVFGIFAGQ